MFDISDSKNANSNLTIYLPAAPKSPLSIKPKKRPNAVCNTKAKPFVGKTQGHISRRVKLLYKCSTLPNSSRKYSKISLYKQAGMHKKRGVYVSAKRLTIFAVHCWGGSYG
jgi:hypothetical protein